MVQSSSFDLLKRLGSGVRPDQSAAAAPSGALELRGFGDLLKAVQAGDVTSDRPLSLAKGAEGKLSPEQLDRLAIAADAAEAKGAHRLLAIVDGLAVAIDIASRTVESVKPHDGVSVHGDVDSVVFLPNDPTVNLRGLFKGDAAAPAAPGLTRPPIRNTGVAELVERLQQSRTAPEAGALKV